MWSLYGVVLVGAVSYGRPVGSQHAREYLHRHLFDQRATFQGSSVAIGIASIEGDTNIALESHIIVLKSSISPESERLEFNSRSSHMRLTYFSSLRILFSSNYSLGWKMCECSLHRICVNPLLRMDSVARWSNGRKDTSDLLPHTSLSFSGKIRKVSISLDGCNEIL